jgi:hypothetical protein|nr:MAG TPA: Major tail protein [Bacteriophage sp.]
MFTPNTNLRLLSTPLESDYSNTLYFANVAAQTAYFTGKTVKVISDFNYIKKDNSIAINEHIDSLYNCNYVMYQNSNFTNKWFYAFIVRMEWLSNNSTRIYLATDVIQTWFFDITYYQSYIDRCHSDTDIVGDNIVPEDFTGAGRGGYDQAGSQDLTPNWVTVFATTRPDGTPLPPTDLSGIISGTGAAWRHQYDNATLTTLLNEYVKNGTATAVAKIQQWPAGNHSATFSFAKHPSTINGYSPKNKKLLSGAFISCYMTMFGQELEFNPEYITGNSVSAQIVVDDTSGSVGCTITNYGNSNIANFSLVAVIPESSWAYNQYKNDYNLHSGSNAIYQERMRYQRNLNAANANVGAVQGIASTIAGAIDTVNPVTWALGKGRQAVSNVIEGAQQTYNQGAIAGWYEKGVDEISQDLATITESYSAPATGSVATSNIYITGNKTALSYGYKVPPRDIIKRCDDYLTVYGYKQSTYKVPNLHARLNWTYIRTLGLRASGNFPDEDMDLIKRIFDKGIFFWSSTAIFGNFDQLNPIV